MKDNPSIPRACLTLNIFLFQFQLVYYLCGMELTMLYMYVKRINENNLPDARFYNDAEGTYQCWLCLPYCEQNNIRSQLQSPSYCDT